MMTYLYGASIQGIQSFIFQTNKLKEIVGASELVEQICTQEFEKFCLNSQIPIKPENFIIKAAGNIKYIFDSQPDCEKVVKAFPMYIANLAPGITISQAVMPLQTNLPEAIDKLEKKLKAQRSKVSMPIETGFMGLERDRRTGGVAFINRPKLKGGFELICEASHLKRLKSDPDYTEKKEEQKENLFSKISNLQVSGKEIPYNIEDINGKKEKSWIAVIYADGNALGILLQKLGENLRQKNFSEEKVKSAFRLFSENLDEATKAAAQFAFRQVVIKTKNLYPIRPVLLGGDDLTVIIRADLALNFTIQFLKEFETQTQEKFSFLAQNYGVTGFEKGITASAGIAYIKETYPLHYGVDLAKKLTKKAKDLSKKLKKAEDYLFIPPSSLAFYKVQSSFIESLEDMAEKTLTAHVSGVSFDYGPYLIHSDKSEPTVDMLLEKLKELAKEPENDKSKGISKLRQWISELYKDKSTADFMLDRMKTVNSDLYKNLKLDEEKNSSKTIMYDVLQLHSFKK